MKLEEEPHKFETFIETLERITSERDGLRDALEQVIIGEFGSMEGATHWRAYSNGSGYWAKAIDTLKETAVPKVFTPPVTPVASPKTAQPRTATERQNNESSQ